MQMEIEYDQLKHQLSPRQKKAFVPPGKGEKLYINPNSGFIIERATLTYDFPPPIPTADKPPIPPPPPPPQSIKQTEYQYDVSPKVNEGKSEEKLLSI